MESFELELEQNRGGSVSSKKLLITAEIDDISDIDPEGILIYYRISGPFDGNKYKVTVSIGDDPSGVAETKLYITIRSSIPSVKDRIILPRRNGIVEVTLESEKEPEIIAIDELDGYGVYLSPSIE